MGVQRSSLTITQGSKVITHNNCVHAERERERESLGARLKSTTVDVDVKSFDAVYLTLVGMSSLQVIVPHLTESYSSQVSSSYSAL